MKKHYRTPLVCTLMLVVFTAMQGTERALPPPAQDAPEKQLAERFKDVMEKEFKAKNVSVSEDAEKELDKITTYGAKRIIEKDATGKLDEADKNFRKFATALIKRVNLPLSPQGEITPRMIDEVLNGRATPTHYDPEHRSGGLCPLFPFC